MLISFFTSMGTAVLGLGGGLILIACMPGLVPPVAIIPVHSVAQLASNFSRAAFDFKSIRWEYGLSFFMGSLLGGILAAQLAVQINLDYIPLFIAAFILFNVWGSGIDIGKKLKGEFFTIGFLQTALGMLVGATGPMGHSTLIRKQVEKDQLVVTSALFMTITHAIKISMFMFLGFSFFQYWALCLGMAVAVIAGSYIGTHMRRRVPDRHFRIVLKLLLTILAVRMIYNTVL
ncbi:MAG: sulfite exporter TauE/SafE family protein [Sedimenticola selenatireducens]|uniref:Probable membrane transporter protein n=1 Tax=Sedimenticola selenatireducens TaxID=191960 RepID=A0A2N6CV29_9GAMM|nr:MAG: sulfite exporter TauE/SafE family protein [Sedimenticola selenatireducens]